MANETGKIVTLRKKESDGSVYELNKIITEQKEEINTLKRRLDELRKAKNNVLIKREREILEVGEPFSEKTSILHEKERTRLKKDLTEKDGIIKKLEFEYSQLRDYLKESEEKHLALQAQYEKLNKPCDHVMVIVALENKVSQLERSNELLCADNQALCLENEELLQKHNEMLAVLSVKEAQICDVEEKMQQELRKQWGEKYNAWMKETESKIAELQKANEQLLELSGRRK